MLNLKKNGGIDKMKQWKYEIECYGCKELRPADEITMCRACLLDFCKDCNVKHEIWLKQPRDKNVR